MARIYFIILEGFVSCCIGDAHEGQDNDGFEARHGHEAGGVSLAGVAADCGLERLVKVSSVNLTFKKTGKICT